MKVAFIVIVLLAWSGCIDAWFGGGGGNSGGGNKGGDKGTKADVGVEASKDGGVSVSGGVSHKGDGWSGGVKGKVDDKGNWEAKAGVSIEIGKRSIDWNGLHYTVHVLADPCDFQVYDGNKDGVIFKNEMHAIFDDHAKAEELFKALDITTGWLNTSKMLNVVYVIKDEIVRSSHG